MRGGVGMTEWINSWKKIADYLEVSVRTAQEMAKRKEITVYKAGGVRADAKELDKHIKAHPLRESA